ncbi:MAG: DNRLRE domain-containing protein [Lentisphaeria bacterium]|nr:DNRLRE domain-containing protein [Lentisphaeria bacterium]
MINNLKCNLVLCVFSLSLIVYANNENLLNVQDQLSLFDFEEKPLFWKTQDHADYTDSEIKITASNQYVTSGQQSMKLSFKQGRLPTVYSEAITIVDWEGFKTLLADIYLERDALVIFRVMQERSTRDNHWDGYMGRYERAALMKKGHHTLVSILTKRHSKFNIKNGKVLRFEIGLYDAMDGDMLFIDHIRLSKNLPPKESWPLTQLDEYFPTNGTLFKVLGTDSQVKNYEDLVAKHQGTWQQPPEKSREEIEQEFRDKLRVYQKKHPEAQLVFLRNGAKVSSGSDEVYQGWDDTYITCHEPESMLLQTGLQNFGNHPKYEIFMRHRVALMRANLSPIPQGAKILEAGLLISRTAQEEPSRTHRNENLWFMELCNRPWVEGEVHAHQYARYKYWNNYSGRQWDGDDPDSLPIFASYGPGQGQNNQWDFTAAIQYWVEEKQPNHGFWLYGDSKDWMLKAHYSESPEEGKRPALAIIYVPAS